MDASSTLTDTQAAVPDERASIIAAAQAWYTEQGLKAVSMADLAIHIRLPTATVLKWFPAQEVLVRAVVDALADQLYQALYRHKQQSRSAVAELLALCQWASHDERVRYALLLQQVQTGFPAAWQRWQEHLAGFPLDHLCNNLRWGVLQEHYLPHPEAEQQVQRWLRLLSTAGHATVVVPHDLLDELLAGIVTPAGALAVLHLQTPLSR